MAEERSVSILQNIATQLRLIHKSLCELIGISTTPPTYTVGAKLCDDSITEETVTSIVQTIPHSDYVQKVQICQSTDIDPEIVCISNDGGTTIVKGWEVFDVSVYPPISTIWLNGVDVTGTYQVVPCESNNKYDYESALVCVDGETWEKWYVWDKQGDMLPNIVSILWIDNIGNIVPAPDNTLINNFNCLPKCEISISDAYGDDLSTLLAGNSLSITKPACCELLITTTVGQFRVIKGVQNYATAIFECPLNIIDIAVLSGNCTLSDIHIISNKTK